MFYLTFNDRERDRINKDNSFKENDAGDRITVKILVNCTCIVENSKPCFETLYKMLPIVERILSKEIHANVQYDF